MKVNTLRFGEVDVPPGQVFQMIQPLIGLADTSFALLWDPQTAPVQWLQSLTTPQLCLPVADPLAITRDYDVEIPPEECVALGLKRIEDAFLMAIIVLDADPAKVRANLRAPVVLNAANHKAKQIVLNDPMLPIKYYIFRSQARPSNREVADVGVNS
jgi:flagellar assembly factor FliW